MAELYRKSALEKISSPDQLDVMLKISSPMSWLALAGATLIVVVTIIWAFVGRIPMTVTTTGIVAGPDGTNAVYSNVAGTVINVFVSRGDKVYEKDKVMEVETDRGENVYILSDQVGYISEIVAPEGSIITQNSEVLRVSPNTESTQVVVCYVLTSDAQKVKRGNHAYISLSASDSKSYGHMVGRVVNIDAGAASANAQEKVLGSDNNLSKSFSSDGKAVTAITCELYPSTQSVSGYFWSNTKGDQLAVNNRDMCSVKIITKQVRPIEKLFEKLFDLWEGEK